MICEFCYNYFIENSVIERMVYGMFFARNFVTSALYTIYIYLQTFFKNLGFSRPGVRSFTVSTRWVKKVILLVAITSSAASLLLKFLAHVQW